MSFCLGETKETGDLEDRKSILTITNHFLLSVHPVVSCADPGIVEHSRRVLSGPHFTVGSTIQYICSKVFTLSGNSLLTCFNRGSLGPKWNQKLPRCLRMYDLIYFMRHKHSTSRVPEEGVALFFWFSLFPSLF